MKAVVFHAEGDIRLDEVAEPDIEDDSDAIVRLTTSAICGTDLHFVRGTMPGTQAGTILGHEGVGIVEKVGESVRNFTVGDRVIIPSTIACGYCHYCRLGYFAQCDNANPNGNGTTAFYGGPKAAGGFNGMQAEKVRVPYANVGLVKIPDEVSDDQAIMLSDIFTTGYFGADLAEVRPGSVVAVFGAGPVGQFAVLSAQLMGASRVLVIDALPDRLAMAKSQGAEVINFEEDHPVAAIMELTGGNGVDHAIDAVGVDSTLPRSGPAEAEVRAEEQRFQRELQSIVDHSGEHEGHWQPGQAPSLVDTWIVQSTAKVGHVGIIGVYPPGFNAFPIGLAMSKNLTIRAGNCNHRKYIPSLLRLIRAGSVDPAKIITKSVPLADAISAYEHFDARDEGWIKVKITPNAHR